LNQAYQVPYILLQPLHHKIFLQVILQVLQIYIISRGEKIEKGDRKVFNKRGNIYQKLLNENPIRMIKYENIKSLNESTEELSTIIKKFL